ncbi:YraN family protein [Collimonas sp.]|jgi:putative endonuclease|uniref:YraN family protein n=1 Tax=Collimonas sp. TaxID=1963772 RepID=UPI0037C0958F
MSLLDTVIQGLSSRRGQAAEDIALVYLQKRGLQLVERNFRCKGGEIDLILSEPGASRQLVFVEVRQRSSKRYGGAAASVTHRKQTKLIIAAQVFLQRHAAPPACRFDVVAIDGEHIEWIRNAFET